MAKIPSAKVSPRVESDGSIRWYYGDTFKLDLQIKIIDKDSGEIIDLQNGDTITVTVYTSGHTVVKEFVFTEFEDNIVTLDFDKETTAKFEKKQLYLYDVTHEREYLRTLVRDNKIIVE